ncbi:MAG: sigma-70 family RNA polymerase sigma factor [Planctomycetota bacterium]
MLTRMAEGSHEREESRCVSRLLTAVRHGEPDAFGPLFDAFRRHLLLVANRELPMALRGKLGPSDLVQETAVDARRDFPGFRGSTAEECFAWLRAILRNNVVDAVRRYETAQKRATSREISLASPAGHREGKSLQMPNGQPDGSAIRREDAALLSAALGRLSADHQAVLRLRYWEGLSFVEIAAEVGRSPDAVRKLWYRAVERLQKEMNSLSCERTAGGGSSGANTLEPVRA